MEVLKPPNDIVLQRMLRRTTGQVELEGDLGGSTLQNKVFPAMDRVGLTAAAVTHLWLLLRDCPPLTGHLIHVAEELNNTTKRHSLVSVQVPRAFLVAPFHIPFEVKALDGDLKFLDLVSI